MMTLLLLALLISPVEPGTLDEMLSQNEPPAARQGIEPGTRVTVTNRNGSVTITGVDAAEVTATARNERSAQVVGVEVVRNGAGGIQISPAASGRGPVTLDVRLPRTALLGVVEVPKGDVRITGVDGDTRVVSGSGDVQVGLAGRVTINAGSGSVVVDGTSGAVYVESGSGDLAIRNVAGEVVFRSGSGDVNVQHVTGAVEGTAASGTVGVHDIGSSVHVTSISGDVLVESAKGHIQAETASGDVRVMNPGGDVEARTASGDAWMTGTIQPGGRYRLKSMSGNATAELCGRVTGFNATLSSYSGDIQTDFELSVDRPNLVTRRLVGRYGDGGAQIELEAFSGSAQLLACPATGQ